MKILLTGGGTMGSTSPLIAISQKLNLECKRQGLKGEFLWFGTKSGPEQKVVEKYGIPFKPVICGKLRRYLSLKNFIDIFLIIAAFFQAFFLLKKEKPIIILSAGSFVSVPYVLAGSLLKTPTLIHQQDLKPGLANRLMAPFAKKITVTFEKSLGDFPRDKVIWTGNPVREEIAKIKNEKLAQSKERGLKMKNKGKDFFNLENNLPVLLVLGGGTGALAINKIVIEALPELLKFCQIIHLTGGRISQQSILNQVQDNSQQLQRYHPYKFLRDKMPDALQVADLVISRAGMSFLSELSYLGKPSLLIPIQDSHQEENANFFVQKKAAEILNQKDLIDKNGNVLQEGTKKIINKIKELLKNPEKLQNLSKNISQIIKKNATETIVNEILKITNLISPPYQGGG